MKIFFNLFRDFADLLHYYGGVHVSRGADDHHNDDVRQRRDGNTRNNSESVIIVEGKRGGLHPG